MDSACGGVACVFLRTGRTARGAQWCQAEIVSQCVRERGPPIRGLCLPCGAHGAVDLVDRDADRFTVLAARETRLQPVEDRTETDAFSQSFQGVTEREAGVAHGGVDDQNDPEFIPFGNVVRAERRVVQQPESGLGNLHPLRKNAEVNGKEHLREASLKIVELHFELAAVTEAQAVRSIGKAVKSHPVISQP